MGLFTFKTFNDAMFQWSQEAADEFAHRVINGAEITVFTDPNNFDCYLDYLKPSQTKIAWHWFEMSCFIGFIRIDSGGEDCQHYIFNSKD